MTMFGAAPTSLLIVDDSTLYRESLVAHLAVDGTEVRVAWDLQTLMAQLDDRLPNVIVLSIAARDSEALLRASTGIGRGVRVIVIGVSDHDESAIVACAESGVAGYHLKSESLEDLISLLQRVSAGETGCPPKVAAIILRHFSTIADRRQTIAEATVLTAREEQILRMLEAGLSNREIASHLCIAIHTVKNHVHSILTKLGVRSRAEAAAQWRTDRSSAFGRLPAAAPDFKPTHPRDGYAAS